MSYGIIINMNVDTHFHIFLKNEVSTAYSRYPVDYDVKINDWLKVANEQQITGGVLVQPSFLGFDNSYLIQAIQQNPKHLRGVAVVEPTVSKETLLDLKKHGIKGIRLNLFGDENPLKTLDENQILLGRLKSLDMHLQLHHDDGMLNELLLNISPGISIVVDHFGKPATDDEFRVNSAGINKHQANLWVKLSAQYRTPNINHQAIFQYWLNKIGDTRLLWGSDWPHTRFEAFESYELQMQKFLTLISNTALKDQILSINPRALYWS
jgi:predicted TIM-barrel fold metal-dependent hydrolase